MTIKCLSSAVYEVVSKYLLNVIFHFLWLNLSQKKKSAHRKRFWHGCISLNVHWSQILLKKKSANSTRHKFLLLFALEQ